MIGEPLTKENFFNELYEKYPKGTQVFCDWEDEYKERVNWEELFSPGDEVVRDAPKFHDLPYAFQLGIWFEFVCERGGCQWEIEDMFEFDLRKEIEEYIADLQFDIDSSED